MKIFVNIVIFIVAVSFLGCATDNGTWRKAVEYNTIDAYQEYLKEYPRGKSKKQAKEKIQKLIEDREFVQAQKVNNIEGYEEYIKNYPNSRHVNYAKEIINQIVERRDFDQAKALNTKQAYEKYLFNYPNGEYVSLANQGLAKLREIIDKAWIEAQKLDTAESYENFLREYPKTLYTSQASKKLEQVGKSKELDNLRELAKGLKEKYFTKNNKQSIFVYAIRETKNEICAYYKNEEGVYYKVTEKNEEVYENGLDLPLLKFAKPKEGVLLYISYVDILKKDLSQFLLGLTDQLFNSFGISDKSNFVILRPKGQFYDRKYSKEEEKNKNLTIQYTFLHELTTIEEQLIDLQDRDPDKQHRAAKVLGIFADIAAIEPLRNASQSDNENVRVEAKKALEAIEHSKYFLAENEGTVEAYEKFLKIFPNSKHSEIITKIVTEEKSWKKAKAANNFRGYAEYLGSYPRGKYVKDAQKEIPKYYALSDIELQKISNALSSRDNSAKKLDVVQKLIFTGASLISKNAEWKDRKIGKVVYNILKKYDSKLLSEAMSKVVLMDINRLHVLFLVVKLGVPGTQQPLNQLLLEYGNKSMAEDYLNSGSRELYQGGKDWANAHGYDIQSGFGSHRVNWGKF